MDETHEVSNDTDKSQNQQDIEPIEELDPVADDVIDDAEAEDEATDIGSSADVSEDDGETDDEPAEETAPAPAVAKKMYAMLPLKDMLDARYKQATEYMTATVTRYSRELSHISMLRNLLPISALPEGSVVQVYDWIETINLYVRTLWDPGLIGEIEKTFEQAGWVEDLFEEPSEESPRCRLRFSKSKPHPHAYVEIIFDAQKEHSMCRLEDTGEMVTRTVEETVHKYRIICD